MLRESLRDNTSDFWRKQASDKKVVGGGWSNKACSVPQSCPTLYSPIDCSPPVSYVHGISQARILEWLPLPTPSNLPDPGIKPASLKFLALVGRFFTTSTMESLLIKCVIKERETQKEREKGTILNNLCVFFFFFPWIHHISHFKWNITIWVFFFNMRFCCCYVFLFDCFALATKCGMWDFIPQTSDPTPTSCSRSVESLPLDH